MDQQSQFLEDQWKIRMEIATSILQWPLCRDHYELLHALNAYSRIIARKSMKMRTTLYDVPDDVIAYICLFLDLSGRINLCTVVRARPSAESVVILDILKSSVLEQRLLHLVSAMHVMIRDVSYTSLSFSQDIVVTMNWSPFAPHTYTSHCLAVLRPNFAAEIITDNVQKVIVDMRTRGMYAGQLAVYHRIHRHCRHPYHFHNHVQKLSNSLHRIGVDTYMNIRPLLVFCMDMTADVMASLHPPVTV